MTDNGSALELASAVSLLESHAGYRVLRSLPEPEAFILATPQGLVRTAAVIDVETIGLDTGHPSSISQSSASHSMSAA